MQNNFFHLFFVKFIFVCHLFMRQKIHTLTRTISMQSVCLLWHYNPLKNITYHRIMNAIITMFFIFFLEQDSNELYELRSYVAAQYDDVDVYSNPKKRDSLQKLNRSFVSY